MFSCKKTALWVFIQVLVSTTVCAQTIFTYGSKPVSKAEFLRAYNKNSTGEKPTEKSYRDYLDLYTRFKIKVQAALDARLDTLPTQQSELQAFRSQVIESFMKDEASVQLLADQAMERNRKDIHLAHIFVTVPKNATVQQANEALAKINSAYAALQRGDDFGKVAARLSEDTSAKTNKGDIGYITTFVLPYEMENIAYTTPVGRYSMPFRSKIGYHIFRNLGERKAFGRMKAAQILLALPPGVSGIQKEQMRRRADSLYTVLSNGSNFREMAVLFSNDNVTYQTGGEMPEFGVGRYEPAFESAAFALATDSAVSRPVVTGFGYHIIRRLQRIPALTNKNDKQAAETVKQQVLQSDRMEVAKKLLVKKIQQQTGFRRSSVNQVFFQRFTDSVLQNKNLPPLQPGITMKSPLFSYGKQVLTMTDWKGYLESIRDFESIRAGKTASQLLELFVESAGADYYRQHLEEYNKDFAYQLEEFREGNLLFEIMQRKVWDLAAADTVGLQKYYDAHRNNYWWESSADAILVTASNDSIAQFARGKLEADHRNWKQLVEQSAGAIQADSGRFELGQIPVRERTNFTEKLITAPVKNDADNSVTFAYIVRLHNNREPRSFSDARGFVINDYQVFLEEQWIQKLKKKYPVRINEDTVRSLPR